MLDNRIKGAAKERLLELRKQLAEFDSLKPESLPTALVVTDIGPQAPPTIIPKKQQTVLPGVPQILQASELPVQVSASGQTTGRRAALARWLTNPANPLAARVMVNRIWQGHFGRGLAPNASDFGTLGGPPTPGAAGLAHRAVPAAGLAIETAASAAGHVSRLSTIGRASADGTVSGAGSEESVVLAR